jgi:hypothetical protein
LFKHNFYNVKGGKAAPDVDIIKSKRLLPVARGFGTDHARIENLDPPHVNQGVLLVVLVWFAYRDNTKVNGISISCKLRLNWRRVKMVIPFAQFHWGFRVSRTESRHKVGF